MKKLVVSLLIIGALSKLNAAVLIVNNNSGANALYTTIDAALAAAAPNDTLYVNGSNVTYSQFTITKSIVIIGQGTFSQKQNAFPSKVNGFVCNSNLSNIVIKGLHLISDASFASKTNISQVEITGNYFTSSGVVNFNAATNCSLINISNNIFGTLGANKIDFVNSAGLSNVLIQNNLIFGSIRSLNASNSLISHNVILSISDAFEFFGGVPFSNVMIKDNIFYNADPIANTTSCTYSNNISFSTGTPYANMIGTGNLDNVNPEFVNVTNGAYTTAFNFHLSNFSPAIGASSTGDDIGIYGGSFTATTTGETSNLPVIRTMDIQNLNVIQNGNVNVKVRSTKAR
ncbi:MAG: hypothetical protein IPP32_02105 [Bacteroidetes bacterium]|nr:hypothetical protein [Bacteroidota bacterium]